MNADAGDDDEEKEEEESENLSKKRKPWGDSSFYCPVALKEQGVLWPGTEEYALRYVCMYIFYCSVVIQWICTIRYRERLFYFSSEEAKQKFATNPSSYLATDVPLEVRNSSTHH